jgi:hypothetical protein
MHLLFVIFVSWTIVHTWKLLSQNKNTFVVSILCTKGKKKRLRPFFNTLFFFLFRTRFGILFFPSTTDREGILSRACKEKTRQQTDRESENRTSKKKKRDLVSSFISGGKNE